MRRPLHPGALEALAAASAFLAGVVIAVVFSFSWPTRGIIPQFYQREFAPAVMLACGRGYVVPAEGGGAALSSFLAQKSASLDCSSIPQVRTTSPNLFQQGQMYLIGSVGVLWKFTGVGWDRLSPLYGLLYGIYALAAYGLFRLGSGRVLALATTLVLVTSTLQLDNLPHLRDFAKAPFILALVLLMGWKATRQLSTWPYLGIAALTGAVMGIGVGFRMDLFLFLPLALATILFFSPGRVFGDLRTKATAGMLMLASFVLFGWPILQAFRGGSNTFHVILLGLMSPFDTVLGVHPSIYEWGYLYNDVYVNNVLNSFVQRVDGNTMVLELATPAYEQAGSRYYIQLLANFPADFALRYFAAVIKTLELVRPSLLVYGLPALFGPPLTAAADAMPWLLLAALAAIFATNRRLGLFCGLMILYLAGVPSLQFHGRHVFHLQFLSLWVLAFLLQHAFVFGAAWFRQGLQAAFLRSMGIGNALGPATWGARAALFAGAAVASLACLIGGLRLWQQAHLVEFFGTYERATSRAVELDVSGNPLGDLLVRLPDPEATSPGSGLPLATHYWVAEFDGSRCEKDKVRFTISYEASDPFLNASRTVNLEIHPSARYFFPTYTSVNGQLGHYSGTRQLLGIGIAEEDAPCLSGIREIGNLERYPLLPSLLLRPGWQVQRLYQQLGNPESPHPVRQTAQVFAFPADLIVNRTDLKEILLRMGDVPVETAQYRAESVTKSGGGIAMNAKVDSVYSYFLQLPPRSVETEAYLIAEGEVIHGGISIGLLKDNRWSGQINITEPGKFIAVVRAEAGEYIATLSNNVPGQRTNHFRLDKLGWVEVLGVKPGASPP